MEVAKLFISFLTPLSIAIVGYLIQKTLAAQARKQKLQERLVDKRLEIYEKIGEDINSIYCYIMDIGTFKNETPISIIEAKRKVDKQMFIYQAIWPEETFKSFIDYMASAFAHFQGGVGADAKIRTTSCEKQSAYILLNKEWPEEWTKRFTEDRHAEHNKRYQLLMKKLTRDLDFMQLTAENKQ